MSFNTRFVTLPLNDFDHSFRAFFYESLESGVMYCLFFRFKFGFLYISNFDNKPRIISVNHEEPKDFKSLLFYLKSDLDKNLELCTSSSSKPDFVELFVMSFKPI